MLCNIIYRKNTPALTDRGPTCCAHSHDLAVGSDPRDKGNTGSTGCWRADRSAVDVICMSLEQPEHTAA